ncbi:DUF2480 family protein [Membranihabitans maritimus]|uniref:DUF2480 family protein n=1 Tax=Membranihabitans maritimus TaxID=2904244 RepID=UPI001F2CD375|nr:DUF2480 family protein [Membranihabitans maritimus]
MTGKTISNKVERSGIIPVNLQDYEPEIKSIFFDIKEGLYMGLMLKEKEFKAFLAEVNWEKYRNMPVAIGCSTDAIIPSWAYMSIAEKLCGIATQIDYTSPGQLDLRLWKERIETTDFNHLEGQKVVVRQNQNIEPQLYLAITNKLKPLVKTLMYGEVGLPKVIYKK